MKRMIAVIILVVTASLLSAPAADACDQYCGITYDDLLYGGEHALCLTFPEDDAFLICIEINALGIHTCYLDMVCRNGYPIP